MQPGGDNKSGQPQQGRPKNSRDSGPRKKKEFKPKVRAALMLWTHDAQQYITQHVSSYALKHFDKKNLCSLSHEQLVSLETIKMSTLYALSPFTALNKQAIAKAMSDKQFYTIQNKYNIFINEVRAQLGRELTTEDIRTLQINFYIQEKQD